MRHQRRGYCKSLGLSQMEYERKFVNRLYPHRTLKTELPFGLHNAACESPNLKKATELYLEEFFDKFYYLLRAYENRLLECE
jgi:hypothetical protein